MTQEKHAKTESSSKWAAFFVSLQTTVVGWGLPQALILASAHLCLQLHLERSIELPTLVIVACGSAGIYGLDRFLEANFQSHLGQRHRIPIGLHALMLLLVAAGFVAGLLWASAVPWWWLGLLALLGLAYLLITIPLVPTFPGLKELLGAVCWTTVVYGPHAWPSTWVGVAALIGLLLLGFSNFAWASHQDFERDAGNGVVTFSQLDPKLNIEMARITAALSIVAFAFTGSSPNVFQAVALLHGAWQETRRCYSIDWCFLPLVVVALWQVV